MGGSPLRFRTRSGQRGDGCRADGGRLCGDPGEQIVRYRLHEYPEGPRQGRQPGRSRILERQLLPDAARPDKDGDLQDVTEGSRHPFERLTHDEIMGTSKKMLLLHFIWKSTYFRNASRSSLSKTTRLTFPFWALSRRS